MGLGRGRAAAARRRRRGRAAAAAWARRRDRRRGRGGESGRMDAEERATAEGAARGGGGGLWQPDGVVLVAAAGLYLFSQVVARPGRRTICIYRVPL